MYQKSVINVQSCCFANLNRIIITFVAFSLPSPPLLINLTNLITIIQTNFLKFLKVVESLNVFNFNTDFILEVISDSRTRR